MIKKLLPLILVGSLTSCATLFSKKSYDLEIASDANSRVKVYDSIYTLPASVQVLRSKDSLPMVLISDTVSKNYILQPSVSPKYLYGNLGFVHFAPLGYLVDLTTVKRFYYGKSVFLTANDTVTQLTTPVGSAYNKTTDYLSAYYFRRKETRKGQINATLSIPWLTNFYFKPAGEGSRQNTGFLGISTGLEYYHSNRKYISVNASAVMDSWAPVPVPVFQEGSWESFRAATISATENHQHQRLSFGYGLQYSRNVWRFHNTDYDPNIPNSKAPFSKTNSGLGLAANVYFRALNSFYVGLNYKPTLFTIQPSAGFRYEHVVSVDLAWKIRLKK